MVLRDLDETSEEQSGGDASAAELGQRVDGVARSLALELEVERVERAVRTLVSGRGPEGLRNRRETPAANPEREHCQEPARHLVSHLLRSSDPEARSATPLALRLLRRPG